MTENSDKPEPKPAPKAAPNTPSGDRIAKVMARAGVASRRDAERLILEGRVAVNGKKIDSPALDVLPSDRITLDGKRIEEPQETRLWLFYKPLGLVTSEKDEKGRQTVFDALPHDLPRVMSVGRLDLNSEGLLLLTNDGELKRRLELPATGWLRRYRVRVNGQPNDLTFDPLRRGITIDGEEFQPMEIKLDSQKGANAWLTVGIREGRNREIRRAMAEVGLMVNRLIRIGYGPFRLEGMAEGELKEVRRRVLKDQLGGLLTGEIDEAPERGERDGVRGDRRAGGRGDRRDGPRDGAGKPRGEFRDSRGEGAPRRPRGDAPAGDAERKDRKPRHGKSGEKPFRRDGEDGQRRDGDRKPYARREDGDRKPYARREDGDRKPYARREDGDRKPYARREDGERKPYARREDGDRKPFNADGERPARRFGDKPGGKPGMKPRGKPFGDRPSGERSAEGKSFGGKPFGRKPDAKGPSSRPRSGGPSGSRGGGASAGPRSGAPRGGKPGPKRG